MQGRGGGGGACNEIITETSNAMVCTAKSTRLFKLSEYGTQKKRLGMEAVTLRRFKL